MILKSYAKVNLYLKVLSRRKDNYHNIRTVFEKLALCDKITLKPRPGGLISIHCNKSSVPRDENNLCYRAAKLLQEKCGVKTGVDITIDKQIPVGAGLGGGSSNAAAVLAGLNRLWKLKLGLNRLINIGRKIGCDVPFFLYDASFALGTSRGDKIRPIRGLSKVKLWHLVVFPNFKVSTPLVYQKFDRISGLTRPGCNVKILTSTLAEYPSISGFKGLFNSLEAVTENEYPSVRRLKELLKSLNPDNGVLMSGSGPTVFTLTRSRQEALLLKKKVESKVKSCEVFVARTL